MKRTGLVKERVKCDKYEPAQPRARTESELGQMYPTIVSGICESNLTMGEHRHGLVVVGTGGGLHRPK